MKGYLCYLIREALSSLEQNLIHFSMLNPKMQEIKQGYLAQKQALVVAKNLKLLLAGGRESKMATYQAHSALALVSLGRKHGLAQFPYTTCIGRLPGLIKSKDLFVGKTRKQLGLEDA